jgi:two-component system CheB/CheR fusion protein
VRDTLVRQVEHVTRLIDDLLDISRVTRGTMSLHLEPVELAGVIARAVDTVKPLLERKHHHFDLQRPEEALWVEGDAIRLAQVFENLLTNAAKYTDEGGEVSLRLGREDGEAVVHVRDNGIGIAPGMQSRMFDLFVQDQRSVDRSQGGLGIGLALVRHLVDLHGGKVAAESLGSGKGSDFMVRLPLLPAEAVPVPAGDTPSDTKAGGRVMLLDDDVDASESLAVLLRLYGFEVETAHDLESGLRTAASFVPQVVVLDLAMPGADGFETARRLRALPALAKTSYVVLSGFGGAEDLARSRLAGFAHHFVKPADPLEMQALLASLIAQQGGEAGSG